MTSRHWTVLGAETSVGHPSFVSDFGLWDERQVAAAEHVEAQLDGVDTVRFVFCDPHGLARSKVLPARVFRSVLRNGMDFSPGPFLFDTGHAVAVDFLEDAGLGVSELRGAGDFILVPDPQTFQVLPRAGERTAWVLGSEYLRDGSPHPLSARNVLRRVCAEYARHDLTPVVGLELEWYLTRLTGGAVPSTGNGFGLQAAAPDVEPMNAGYQFNLDTYVDSVAHVIDPIAEMVTGLGLPLRSIEHESGPGQIETTFDPMAALDTADAMLLLRTQLKQVCRRRGHHASFMTLPRLSGFDASGWHLHQSVLSSKTNTNVFAGDDPGGPSLSAAGHAYVEGLVRRARELCLLSVPTVNGYRRLGSGFTLAPGTADWKFEDRSAMVRVVGGGSSTHVENRIAEPCANPYLAIAAQLDAGLEGLLDGGTPQRRPVPALPSTMSEALSAFEASDSAERLLGRPLKACLSKLKASEAARFRAWQEEHGSEGASDDVTEWEHREYFDTY